MQVLVVPLPGAAIVRYFKRFSMLLLVTLLLSQAATAQQTTPMSPSVVLVLKLVSATHVKPATGIVVSDNGLVLVSADIVSEAGEIVVLDGGTDILSHGRPAKLVTRSSAGRFALLSVEGLKRPGFLLSAGAMSAQSAYHLAAFPPAQYLAKGAQPIWEPVKVLIDQSNQLVSISDETPLPHVSGPIIDECGHLAGLSLTHGAQSLETVNKPVTFFADDLNHLLDSMQIILTRAGCKQFEKLPEDSDVTTPAPKPPAKTTEPVEMALQATETGSPEVDLLESAGSELSADAEQVVTVDPGEVTSVRTLDPPSLWHKIPPWLWFAATFVLMVLVWKGIFFFRLSKNGREQDLTSGSAHRVQPASDEPDTTRLETGVESPGNRPRSAPLDETELPDISTRPPGCDGLVLVAGTLASGTRFKRFCFVNTEQINIVIGRGETDISIEDPTISRAHARLEGHADFVTLSDLGSSNGTFIRDIPCLPGEVMMIETDDEITVGEVRFHIRVIRQEAQWA